MDSQIQCLFPRHCREEKVVTSGMTRSGRKTHLPKILSPSELKEIYNTDEFGSLNRYSQPRE